VRGQIWADDSNGGWLCAGLDWTGLDCTELCGYIPHRYGKEEEQLAGLMPNRYR